MAPLCSKCNMTITNKQYLKCSYCKKHFHVLCSTVSEARYKSFYVFNKENKENWKCSKCSKTQNKIISNSSPLQGTLLNNKQKYKTRSPTITQNTSPGVSQNSNPSTTPCDAFRNVTSSPGQYEEKLELSTTTEGATCNINLQNNSTTPDMRNITKRNKKTYINIDTTNSFESLLSESDDVDDEAYVVTPASSSVKKYYRSLDNSIQENLTLTVQELKESAVLLKAELSTTQEELENTIIDNNNLQRLVQKLTKEVNILKAMCTAPPMRTRQTNSCIRNNKRNAMQLFSKTRLSLSSPTASLIDSPFTTSQVDLENLQMKIELLQHELKMAKDEINILNIRLREALHTCKDTKCSLIVKPSPIRRNQSERRNVLRQAPHEKVTASKILIISSNKRNKVLQIIEGNNNLCEKYNICHHIVPGAGTKELLYDIVNTLQTFTVNDYCIILIGDSDFRSSQNYISLVQNIRVSLEKVKHTNIILATPTYVCGATIYNCRVETFNSLLYMDVLVHEHAYFLDSNLKLSLDMFSSWTGKLNNRGMENIFQQIQLLISQLNFFRGEIE